MLSHTDKSAITYVMTAMGSVIVWPLFPCGAPPAISPICSYEQFHVFEEKGYCARFSQAADIMSKFIEDQADLYWREIIEPSKKSVRNLFVSLLPSGAAAGRAEKGFDHSQ